MTAKPADAPPRPATTTLHRRLVVLAIPTVVPLLAFVAAIVAWSSYNYHEAARQGLERSTRTLSLAVDEQIITWKAALTALATSPALDHGDYATFRHQAALVTERFGGWLALSLPSGQQVVNTIKPVDSALPVSNPAGLPPAVTREGKADVSNLFFGAVSKRPTIAVTVPAVRDGAVTHALHLGLLPKDLSAFLVRQHLPAGWIAFLVDSHDRMLARAPYAANRIGKTPPDWYRRAIAAGTGGGVVRGRSRTGVDVYGSLSRLKQAPWTLALAAPSAKFVQAWQRPLIALAGGGAMFVIAILTGLIVMGRRLAQPINALAGAARAALRGEAPPPVPPSSVREIRELGSAVMALSQKQVLLREVNHRIKNSLQLVSATLGLHSRTTPDKETREHLVAAQGHIQAVARLHERLYQTDRYESVEAFALARAACEDIATISVGRALLRIETEGIAHIRAEAGGPFVLIVVELATNAVKHASEAGHAGTVDVRCRVEDGAVISVVVSDNGRGLPPNFELAGQTGTGLRMCLALSTQIGGTLKTIPTSGGAAFELRLPARPEAVAP